MSFSIDFLTKALQYRIKKVSLKKELLARAIGIHPHHHPYIVDATAGLGRDSIILAALAYKVTMIERSPILFTLLEEALKKASADNRMLAIINNLQLIKANAITWLRECKEAQLPDIIYLDPMFPPRKKMAAVKKDISFLHSLLKDEVDDSKDLFEQAFACARCRVVVKRPRYEAPMVGKLPSFSLKGNHSRFDVYLTKG